MPLVGKVANSGHSLAHDDHALFARRRQAGGVLHRLVAGKGLRAALGRHVPGVKDIFHAQCQAVQRPLDCTCIERLGARQREIRVDKGKSLHLGLARGNALQAGLDIVLCAERARLQSTGGVERRHGSDFVELVHVLAVAVRRMIFLPDRQIFPELMYD